MSLILSTRAKIALCTDEWWCVLGAGIDMKSVQPQSRKIENKGVEVNELLMPCSAPLYGLCVMLIACLNNSCSFIMPTKTSVNTVLLFLSSLIPFFFSTQYQILPIFRDHIISTSSYKVTVVFQILPTLKYITEPKMHQGNDLSCAK